MLNIAPPPPTLLPALLTFGVAGLSMALGGALVLWGRVLSRSFLAAAGAAAGVLLAESLARRFNLPIMIVSVVAILGFAVIGAIAARIVWAAAGGAVFGLAALTIMLGATMEGLPAASQPASVPATDIGPRDWIAQSSQYVFQAATAAWAGDRTRVLWTICLGGGVPLVMLLLLPRVGRIFMTALIGSVALSGGVLLTVSGLSGTVWPTAWAGYRIWLGMGLVVLVFSLVFQYCGDIAARRAAKQAQDQAHTEESGGKKGRAARP